MTYMWNEIKEQPEVIERCLRENSDTVKKVAEEIRNNKIYSVFTAARGTSNHAGIYGKYIMEQKLGIPVALAAPSVFTLYNKEMNLENSLVIGISQSGKAADALEVIKCANKKGAITLSITNFDDSPLAVEAKYHLNCVAGVEKSVAATKTFTAQLVLLAMLTAELSGDEDMKNELKGIPAGMRQCLELSEIIKDKVQRYRYMNECFVLARGTNYAIALETALKIQETTYARAKGFATSDFQHGPIAMVDENIPVIVLAPEGPSFSDLSAMVDRLLQNNVELIIVSNNDEILKKATLGFKIPCTNNDIISPFYNALIAQMFACELSQAKGLNPDTPRRLNKITVTK